MGVVWPRNIDEVGDIEVISDWVGNYEKILEFKISAIAVCPWPTFFSSFYENGDQTHDKFTSRLVGTILAVTGKGLKFHIQDYTVRSYIHFSYIFLLKYIQISASNCPFIREPTKQLWKSELK